jgi:hypothetical protein
MRMTMTTSLAEMTARVPDRRMDCCIFVGSTYSFLTAHRAAAHGIALDWKPFSLRTLLREQDSTPFRPAACPRSGGCG